MLWPSWYMTSLVLAPVLAARVPARWRRSWRWDLGKADLGSRLGPGVLPDVGCEQPTLLAGEDVAGVAGLGVVVEVAALSPVEIDVPTT